MGESDTTNRVKRGEVGIQAVDLASVVRLRGRRNSSASYESSGMSEMGQQVVMGTKYSRSTDSSYPTSIRHPGTEYSAYDNAQHVQNVFVPAFGADADISIECLKPDENQDG